MFGVTKEKWQENKPKLEIIKMRCPQNHRCPAVHVCPTDALEQQGFAAPTVDNKKCISCGECVRFCPMNAIVLE